MNTIQMLCEWLEQSGFNTVIAKNYLVPTVLFYHRFDCSSLSERIVYAISVENNLCHIGNISAQNENYEIGYVNAIRTKDITAELLSENISQLTEQIDILENNYYLDDLMYRSQKFQNVQDVISCYM